MKTLRLLSVLCLLSSVLCLSGCVAPQLVRETKTRISVPTQRGPATIEFAKDAKIAEITLKRDPVTNEIIELRVIELETSASSVIDSAAVAQAEANKANAETLGKIIDFGRSVLPAPLP